MKGLSGGVLAATPLALIILYFALSGQQLVRTDQQRVEIKQQIDESKFDLEFEKLSSEISGKPMTADAISKKEEEITELRKKSGVLDERLEAELKKAEQELAELKAAIEETN
ncbi:MAG: hypothetical protein ACK4FN_02805 [Acinetobacter johnsonii]